MARKTKAKAVEKDLEAQAQQVAAAGEWLSLDEVELWEKNPRINDGDNTATEDVAASIKRFGFIAGVTGWLRPDGSVRMVAGHTRAKALRLLLAREGPGYTPKHAPGPGLVPGRKIPFANEAEANAYALVDNRTSEKAEWNPAGLAEVVKSLRGSFEGLEAIGWDAAGLKKIADWKPKEAPTQEIVAVSGTYAILVTCKDELQQRQLLERFTEEELECRAWNL